MSSADAIAQAGYNVNNLLPEQIDLDLSTDVPMQSPLAEVRAAADQGASVDLETTAKRLYGDWRFVFTMKGRSAELALARAVFRPGMTVLINGLFRTTQRSITTQGAKVEVMPATFQVQGTSDISLEWLAERFSAGPVDAVYLEPTNNAIFGWPMHLAHLRAVKAECVRHKARLYLDASRLLANCAGDAAVLDSAREYLSLADAFVTATAKECLIPLGGVVGVRDLGVQRQCWLSAFEEGSALESLPLRAQLAAGMQTIGANPGHITDRRRQLEVLARLLRGAGIQYVEPVGGHAVYALFPQLATDRPTRSHEVQAHLFAHSGIKFMFGRHPAHPGFVVRLALSLARYQDRDLERIVNALKLATAAPAIIPPLVAVAGEPVHEQYFTRYALAGAI
jgi:tryptophanase